MKLPQEWHYYAHVYVNWIARNYKISSKTISSFINKNGFNYDFGFIVPLAPIGPHITLNPEKAVLNKKVKFNIKNIYTVPSYDCSQIAMFSPPKQPHHILQWFLLEVDLPEQLKPKKGLPHITLASYVGVTKR